MKIFLLYFLFVNVSIFAFPLKPDHSVSPGNFCTINDPDFEEFRYEEEIPYCKRNVSYARKDAICLRDGVYDRTDFVVDHIIPLSIGGSNKDDNLWCQHKTIMTARLEYRCYLDLRNRLITRLEAVTVLLNCKFYNICPETCNN